MSKRIVFVLAVAAIAGATALQPSGTLHGQASLSRAAAFSAADLRVWDARVDRMLRDRQLIVREQLDDPLVAGRTHERYTQVVNGVPVYGGDMTRQIDGAGATVSIFGTVYEGIEIDTTPRLSVEEARAIVEEQSGVELGESNRPTLTILPRPGGEYALVYQARVATTSDVTLYFVDARSGAIVKQRSDRWSQDAAAVGPGVGVLGDRKKVSASTLSGGFVAADLLRPPRLRTYDMRGNLSRVINFLNGVLALQTSDLATDSDNDWTDGANVDAHVYQGLTYDYYFKRFGRRGLDNRDIRIIGLTHPVNRSDVFTAPGNILGAFYVNAFYAGNGIMVYGEGLPPGIVLLPARQTWNFLAGALDVVGHELTHGVTEFSSNLIYENESGALNEAFSDIMGTSIEFFYQQPGSGSLRADYLIGEDVISAGQGTGIGPGLRSMASPTAYGDPDNFSIRYTGPADNGGVHTNSGIANNAFYLSIEGGTNGTSRQSVTGVGAANRERMEKVWYRAFAQLLSSNASFADARNACIAAARDLYGANSNEERAVTQAWSAVGIN
jgi:bacillolysin